MFVNIQNLKSRLKKIKKSIKVFHVFIKIKNIYKVFFFPKILYIQYFKYLILNMIMLESKNIIIFFNNKKKNKSIKTDNLTLLLNILSLKKEYTYIVNM